MKLIRDFKRIRKYDAQFESVAKEYGYSKTYLYLDAIKARIVDGMEPHYYFAFRVYQLNQPARNRFTNNRKLRTLEKIFNTNSNKRAYIQNKVGFLTNFSDFVCREWMYTGDHTQEEIVDFLRRNQKVIVKPTTKLGGIGIYQLNVEDLTEDLETTAQKLKDELQLLEALICQHPTMSAINPTSVNTIRVPTVRDRNGDVHFLPASLRAGGMNAVVDNHTSGGVQYPVDINTGIVIGGGSNHAGDRTIYFHPSTNTKMIGFEIPHWDCVLATVEKAAKSAVDIRYVGWDVAITPEGCELIEANVVQGSNGMQLDGIGKYPYIMQFK